MRRAALASSFLAVLAAGCPSSSSAPPPPTGKAAGETCASASECQAGLFCFATKCASSYAAAPTCPPPGVAPAPTAGAPVDVGDPGQCVTAPAPARFADGTVQGGGTFKVGDTFTFTVPAGTTGFSIIQQRVQAPIAFALNSVLFLNAAAPTNLKRPDGSLFYSDTVQPPIVDGYFDATGAQAYFIGTTAVTGVFTVPNTSAGLDVVRSAGQVEPGTWSFTVNDFAYECATDPGFQPICTGGRTDSTYQVLVLTHAGATTAPTLRSTGTVDLEIYLATTSATLENAAFAVTDPQIVRFVESMRSYYSRVGICIGNVTFHDLPTWAKNRYAPLGQVDISQNPPCDPLSQLFTLGVAGSGAAVHLFLADALVEGPGGTPGFITIGVDGAIPGPSGVPGTVAGGAIVGLFSQLGYEKPAGACSGPPDLARCGTDLVAYVAAHEAGHWLGLYHTTEATGDFFDPLDDTATCPCLSCAPVTQRGACSELGSASSPTIMESAFCEATGPKCGGATNLMFWLVDDRVSTGELTPEQGEVMRQNPAVR